MIGSGSAPPPSAVCEPSSANASSPGDQRHASRAASSAFSRRGGWPWQRRARRHARTGRQARTAITAIVASGDQLSAAAPYGYRITTTLGRRADGRPRRRLTPDPDRAVVAARIFGLRVEYRWGPTAIARHLNDDPFVHPPRDRDGRPRAWTPGIVRHILADPVYTGVQVWGRTRAGRPRPPTEWVLSGDAHAAIVDPDVFAGAQQPLTSRRGRT